MGFIMLGCVLSWLGLSIMSWWICMVLAFLVWTAVGVKIFCYPTPGHTKNGYLKDWPLMLFFMGMMFMGGF